MAQTLHDYVKTKYTADVVGLYGGRSQHGKVETMKEETRFRVGDKVKHKPSGATCFVGAVDPLWRRARVHVDDFTSLGWVPEAHLSLLGRIPSPVKPPLVDALGRPVPEEYREAYELLAAGGRRVMCVEVGCTVPGERVAGDAIVCRDGVGIWKADRFAAPYPHSPWAVAYAYNVTHADAARRALAMEAERPGKTEPANDDAIAEAAEARRAAAEKPADPMQGRTKCPCCGGPGVELFLTFECQRVGGCKTKAERVAALVPAVLTWKEWAHDHDKPEHPDCGSCIVVEAEKGYETRYGVCIDRGIRPRRFATLDGAVSAWRTAMAERMGE